MQQIKYIQKPQKSQEKNCSANGTSDYPIEIANLSSIFFFSCPLSKKVCFCVFLKWTVWKTEYIL